MLVSLPELNFLICFSVDRVYQTSAMPKIQRLADNSIYAG